MARANFLNWPSVRRWLSIPFPMQPDELHRQIPCNSPNDCARPLASGQPSPVHPPLFQNLRSNGQLQLTVFANCQAQKSACANRANPNLAEQMPAPWPANPPDTNSPTPGTPTAPDFPGDLMRCKQQRTGLSKPHNRRCRCLLRSQTDPPETSTLSTCVARFCPNHFYLRVARTRNACPSANPEKAEAKGHQAKPSLMALPPAK